MTRHHLDRGNSSPMIGNLKRHHVITIIMLVAGLGCAVVIYLTAGNPATSSMVDEFEESKRFMHDLELYGGKANVAAYKFLDWFDGLWHGQALAFTIAFLTVVISLGYLFIASRLEAHSMDSGADEDRRKETGQKP